MAELKTPKQGFFSRLFGRKNDLLNQKNDSVVEEKKMKRRSVLIFRRSKDNEIDTQKRKSLNLPNYDFQKEWDLRLSQPNPPPEGNGEHKTALVLEVPRPSAQLTAREAKALEKAQREKEKQERKERERQQKEQKQQEKRKLKEQKENEKREKRDRSRSRRKDSSEEDAKPKVPKPDVFADCYNELPDDLKALLIEEEFTEEMCNNNWLLLIRILRFRLKREFFSKDERALREEELKKKEQHEKNGVIGQEEKKKDESKNEEKEKEKEHKDQQKKEENNEKKDSSSKGDDLKKTPRDDKKEDEPKNEEKEKEKEEHKDEQKKEELEKTQKDDSKKSPEDDKKEDEPKNEEKEKEKEEHQDEQKKEENEPKKEPPKRFSELIQGKKNELAFYRDTRFVNQDIHISEGNPQKLYRDLHRSGKGSFGRVYVGTCIEDRHKYAIKVMPHTSDSDVKHNKHEIIILSNCSHPNICKYYKSYIVDDKIWIVIEFLEGGTLTEAVMRHLFTEREIVYVAKQMLKGCAYLHSIKIVHRDIKSANVMLTTTGHVKLNLTNGLRYEMVGSPLWIPPEMILNEPHDFKVDIWSLAVCLLELANQQPPNFKHSIKAMFKVATEGLPNPLRRPEDWTPMFREFISKALTYDPKKRPPAAELLRHPLFKEKIKRNEMRHVISHIFLRQTIEMLNI